jgi:hypothetical protein
MGLPLPPPPSAVLPYGQASRPKEGFRILGLIVGACFGIVAAITAGICVAMAIECVKAQLPGRIASRMAGVSFLIATVACTLTVVDLRRREVWFLRGFLVGSATLFLIFGMMCLLR